jgi:hypothetical protein
MLSSRVSCTNLARKVLSTSAQLRAFTSEVDNPNRGIIEMLTARTRYYPTKASYLTHGMPIDKEHEDQQPNPTRNAYKVRAFQSAIDTIQNLDQPIHSVDQVRDVIPFLMLLM